MKAAITHAGGGADLNLEVEGAPPLFCECHKKNSKADFLFSKQNGLWSLLKYLKLYGSFDSDGNVRPFFFGGMPMDWNLNRDS